MKPETPTNSIGIALRAGVIWLVIIFAETLHGIARSVLLVPYVGEFRSSQIGVFTGSIIILTIAVVFVGWLRARQYSALLMVGVFWTFLTIAFEILLGRFVIGLSWEQLASDDNVLEGGLLPTGLLVLLLSPLIAAKVRRLV